MPVCLSLKYVDRVTTRQGQEEIITIELARSVPVERTVILPQQETALNVQVEELLSGKEAPAPHSVNMVGSI